METTIPDAPPPSVYELTQAMAEINGSVQESCAEMSALARLVLAALHAPQERQSRLAMAHAVSAIRDSADLLAGHVKVEVRRLT